MTADLWRRVSILAKPFDGLCGVFQALYDDGAELRLAATCIALVPPPGRSKDWLAMRFGKAAPLARSILVRAHPGMDIADGDGDAVLPAAVVRQVIESRPAMQAAMDFGDVFKVAKTQTPARLRPRQKGREDGYGKTWN